MKEPSQLINELNQFTSEQHIEKVYYAENSLPPAIYSFVVNFPSIALPLEGRYRIDMAQKAKSETIVLNEGDALFAPANCWYTPNWNEPGKVLTILFGMRHTGLSLVTSSGGEEPELSVKKFNFGYPLSGIPLNILTTLRDLTGEKKRTPVDNCLTEALLHSIIALLESPEKESGSKAHHLYEKICLYVQENFHAALTRDYVSKQFHITPNHLSRLFRNEGCMKFSEYLTYVRMDRAKFMLKSYDMTLDEVTMRCGYDDSAYFCRVFKKIAKLTPTQYRNKYGKK